MVLTTRFRFSPTEPIGGCSDVVFRNGWRDGGIGQQWNVGNLRHFWVGNLRLGKLGDFGSKWVARE